MESEPYYVASVARPGASYSGMFPCRRLGFLLHLVLKLSEGLDHHLPDILREDDLVDKAQLSSPVRTRELLYVILYKLGSPGLRVLGLGDLLPEEDLIAPSGPITAISAEGNARFMSARRCLLDITT